jgi:hypothetical protein
VGWYDPTKGDRHLPWLEATNFKWNCPVFHLGLSENGVPQLQTIINWANLSCYLTQTWGLPHFWTNKHESSGVCSKKIPVCPDMIPSTIRLSNMAIGVCSWENQRSSAGGFRPGHRRGGSCLVLYAKGTVMMAGSQSTLISIYDACIIH